MSEVIFDSLIDSLKTLPFLFAVYLIIEFIEHRALDKIRAAFSNEKLGIVSAAALGLFPQCGFSVAAANLYSEKLITAGTLVAVFISTSDEAVPIFASNSESLKWLLPLLGVKFIFAVAAGFIVNALFRVLKLNDSKKVIDNSKTHIHENGEHHHCDCCDSRKGILRNVFTRTLSIFVFILATTLLLNIIIYLIGDENLKKFLLTDSIFQPMVAALIGLIPNCAASVVLSQLFVAGTISFGSLTAGLCAGAGVGMLVLFRVNRPMKQNFAILGILYTLSAVAGLILQFVLR